MIDSASSQTSILQFSRAVVWVILGFTSFYPQSVEHEFALFSGISEGFPHAEGGRTRPAGNPRSNASHDPTTPRIQFRPRNRHDRHPSLAPDKREHRRAVHTSAGIRTSDDGHLHDNHHHDHHDYGGHHDGCSK